MNAVHCGGVLGNRGDHHLPRGHDETRGHSGERAYLQDLRGRYARAPRVPVDLSVGVGLHRNTFQFDVCGRVGLTRLPGKCRTGPAE